MTFSPLSVVILRGRPSGATSRPHPALAGHVSLFWEMALESGPNEVRSLPDACVDVTFDLAAPAPAAYVTGPQLEPRTFQLEGRVALFGVRLLPGAAPLVLGGPAGSDTLWVPLAAWLGDEAGRLVAAVHAASGMAARIELLEEWLTRRLMGASDPVLARAIEIVFRSAGTARISDFARAAGMSERALSRLFSARVGLPPKRFSRVVRFQHALRRIEGAPDWAGLAAELGYFDQAHLIREFKELFGCTPTEALALAPDAPR